MSMERFEVVLNNSKQTWLNDHRVLGKCIFPAAGYIELVLANLDLLDHTADDNVVLKLEKFKILAPLIFEPGVDKRIEIEIPRLDATAPCRVKTKNPDNTWTIHAEGYIKCLPGEKGAVLDIEEIKSRCWQRFAGQQYYLLYRQAGVEYGPFFKSIESLMWNETEVISELSVKDIGSTEGNCFYLHPAFLDGAFQSVGIFPFFESQQVLYLPFYIDSIVVHAPLADNCYCYGKLMNKPNSSPGILKFDIGFCDRSGQVLVDIKGFCLKSLPSRHIDAGEKVLPRGNYRPEDVAVIGMAGRFPGAENLEEFWENLAKGVPVFSEIPKERWDIVQFYDKDPGSPGKTICRYGCFLADIDRFDPMFFGISVNKAEYIDPQQRLMLETAFHAIEDAGYGNNLLSKTKTGVYIGVSHNEYIHRGERGLHKVLPHVASGNAFSAIANRISYFLDLTGPSAAIDTACSSSLVALYYAVRDIIGGECEYALVGSVNLTLSPSTHIIFDKLGVLSPDGICQPFDKNARGYIRGEGVGAVLLKSLNQAVADRDNIHAVIKGISVCHKGRSNGFLSPSSVSETSVILDTYRGAGINPETVSYIEAHGTGTPLGDQIEFRGLVTAFRKYTAKRGFCAIGSIKSNIGHLESAAGIASVLKTIMALKKQQIPPLLNFNTPNNKIAFNQSPFFVNDKPRTWENQAGPRRAGVSAFGFGGTNTHLILEEHHPAVDKSGKHKHTPLLTLSAQSAAVVQKMIAQIIGVLNTNPDSNLVNICGTLNSGRYHFDTFRLAVLGSSCRDMIHKLSTYLESGQIPSGVFVSGKTGKRIKVAFLFGPTYPVDTQEFFQEEPIFEKSYRDWETRVKQQVDQQGEHGLSKLLLNNNSQRLKSFLHGLCLAHVLQAYGIEPQVVGGIEIGEIIAALMANCLSVADALKLIAGSQGPLEFNQLKIPFLQENNGTFRIYPAYLNEPIPLQLGQNYLLDSARSWLEKNDYPVILEPAKIQSMQDLNVLAARLYAQGVNINWKEYYKGDEFHRVSLPTYPFKRTRYWLD